jgi:hypothetical protein
VKLASTLNGTVAWSATRTLLQDLEPTIERILDFIEIEPTAAES